MQNQENRGNIAYDMLPFIIRKFLIEFIEKEKDDYNLNSFQEYLLEFLSKNNLVKDENKEIEEKMLQIKGDVSKLDKKINEILYNYFNEENKALSENEDVLNVINDWMKKKGKEFLKETEDNADEYWFHTDKNAKDLLELIKRLQSIPDGSIQRHYSKNSADINDAENRYISELIQNVDDCVYDGDGELRMFIYNNALVLRYNERGFTHKNILAISSIGNSDKVDDPTKTGEKGRGFKTIFYNHKKVEVQSRWVDFTFNEQNVFELKDIKVMDKKIKGSRIIAYFKIDKSEASHDPNKFYGFIKESFQEQGFCFNPLMFTRNIERIEVVRVDGEVGEVESLDDIEKNENGFSFEKPKIDKENIILFEPFLDEQREELYRKRFPEWDNGRITIENLTKNNLIQIMACPKNEMLELEKLNKKFQIKGHLYTFLPTSTDLDILFAINAPFFLSENRAFPIIDTGKAEEEGKVEFNKELLNEIFKKNGELNNWYQDNIKKLQYDIFYYLPTGDSIFVNRKVQYANEMRQEEEDKQRKKEQKVETGVNALNKWFKDNKELIDFKELEVFKPINWAGNKDVVENVDSVNYLKARFLEEEWMYDFYKACPKNGELSKWLKNQVGDYILCENPLLDEIVKEKNILKNRIESFLSSAECFILAEKWIRALEKEASKCNQDLKVELLEALKKSANTIGETEETFFRIILNKQGEEKAKIFPYWKKSDKEEILCFESLKKENNKRWFINKTGKEYKNSYDDDGVRYLVFNGDGSDLGIDDIIKKNEYKLVCIEKPDDEMNIPDYIGLKIINAVCEV